MQSAQLVFWIIAATLGILIVLGLSILGPLGMFSLGAVIMLGGLGIAANR